MAALYEEESIQDLSMTIALTNFLIGSLGAVAGWYVINFIGKWLLVLRDLRHDVVQAISLNKQELAIGKTDTTAADDFRSLGARTAALAASSGCTVKFCLKILSIDLESAKAALMAYSELSFFERKERMARQADIERCLALDPTDDYKSFKAVEKEPSFFKRNDG